MTKQHEAELEELHSELESRVATIESRDAEIEQLNCRLGSERNWADFGKITLVTIVLFLVTWGVYGVVQFVGKVNDTAVKVDAFIEQQSKPRSDGDIKLGYYTDQQGRACLLWLSGKVDCGSEPSRDPIGPSGPDGPTGDGSIRVHY